MCLNRLCIALLSQIIAIDKYLTSHDWVMWLDCDSLIMNFSIPIEQIVWSALSAAEDPDEVHLIISEDGAMINTGASLTAFYSCGVDMS